MSKPAPWIQLLIQRVRTARDHIATAAMEADQVRADPRYSAEYKATKIKGVSEAATSAYSTELRRMTDAVAAELRTAEANVAKLRPSQEAMNVAAFQLKPVLDVATQQPEAVLKAYERTYADPAARAMLEQLASSLQDVLPQHQINTFVPRFERLQARLADRRSDEEKAAHAALTMAQQAAEYAKSAVDVINAEASDAISGVKLPSSSARIHLTHAQFAMQQFEQHVEQETAAD